MVGSTEFVTFKRFPCHTVRVYAQFQSKRKRIHLEYYLVQSDRIKWNEMVEVCHKSLFLQYSMAQIPRNKILPVVVLVEPFP